jgi:hypothetical protein
LLFVLFYVLFVCKCILPPGDDPTAVNKYIISLGGEGTFLFNIYVDDKGFVTTLIVTQN